MLMLLRRRTIYSNKVLSIAPASLLAYWKLAESSGTVLTDSSSNGRNGVYSGVTLGQPGIGDGGTCPSWDGVNDYGNLYSAGLAAAFNGLEGTLALWFRVASAGVWTDATTRRLVSITVDAANAIKMTRDATNNQLSIAYITPTSTKTVMIAGQSSTDWGHLALTWSRSADQVKGYLNGVQQGATLTGLTDWVGTPAATTTVLGANTTAGVQPWSGRLAHAALWSVALSGAQIAAVAVRP